MPRKEFAGFTRLDASDVNTFLMDQSVQTFAGTAARGSAIATPVEGMVTYLNDINSLSVYNGDAFTTDRTIQVFAGTAARGSAIGTAVEGMYTHINDTDSLEYYNGSAWVAAGGGGKILQVVSATKTDPFTASVGAANTYSTDAFTISITPSSASSKVFVSGLINFSSNSGNGVSAASLFRNGTAVLQGDAVGSRGQTYIGRATPTATDNTNPVGFAVLDSPATTSAITYSIRIASDQAATVYLNRSKDDSNGAFAYRSASSMVAMEVAG
jgi:hypothetical protein